MKYLRIGNYYFNLNNIKSIQFKTIKNIKNEECICHIIVDDIDIKLSEQEYRNTLDEFVMLVGEYNIYE